MQLLQKKQWVLRSRMAEPCSAEDIRRVSEEFGIPPLVASILFSNKVESFSKYLHPTLDKLYDPFLMKGMQEAVLRIEKAIQSREKILVYGDYDVDGITSTAILTRFLTENGAKDVVYRIPDRQQDGYGLKSSAIDYCQEKGISLLITVDCGITSVEEVAYGREKGVDVIITDHHECKEMLPDAVAVLNPKQKDCPYPFKSLAGVGVAFKLLHGLVLSLGLDEENFFSAYIDIVSLGTVADVMPLIDENRILVKNGLIYLAKTKNPGLKALMAQAGVDVGRISTGTVGFALAPRINAAGRIDEPSLGVELLLAENEADAVDKAKRLDEINRDRQAIEQEIFEEALLILEKNAATYAEDYVLVLAKDGWHSGVIGIVASKITEKFHKPCILISGDGTDCKGSGRSIKGFNLFEALSFSGEHLIKFGGHELAAGLTVAADKIDAFRVAINQYAKTVLSPEDFLPKLLIDTKLPICYASLSTVEKLAMMEPFGMANPNPVFYCDKLKITGIYTMSEGKHMRLSVTDGNTSAQLVGFSMGDLADKLQYGDMIDIAYHLEENVYRGERKSQILLKDLRRSS